MAYLRISHDPFSVYLQTLRVAGVVCLFGFLALHVATSRTHSGLNKFDYVVLLEEVEEVSVACTRRRSFDNLPVCCYDINKAFIDT
ncbi:uncharacterized protein BYT42DRAFT_578263, partial [Radiomyces spectabilis]|uniref:uncharacterized protein n=1 Tax=Radiomyces spectabilis TaxID=64574 RepID=UPI00221E51D5